MERLLASSWEIQTLPYDVRGWMGELETPGVPVGQVHLWVGPDVDGETPKYVCLPDRLSSLPKARVLETCSGQKISGGKIFPERKIGEFLKQA